MTPYTIQSCEADKGKKGVDYHPVNIYQSEKSGNQRQRKKRSCLAWKPQQSPQNTLLLWANSPPHINYFIFFSFTISYQLLYTGAMYISKKKKILLNSPSRTHSFPPILPPTPQIFSDLYQRVVIPFFFLQSHLQRIKQVAYLPVYKMLRSDKMYT